MRRAGRPGGGHHFRIDKPLISSDPNRRPEHFTRVEVFGDPGNHWLSVRIEPDDPNVFSFHPRILLANVRRHAP